MANLTSLLYPISAAVTTLPSSFVTKIDNIYNAVYWENWTVFTHTTTSTLTSRILNARIGTFLASIHGISFAPYDQYLQIWDSLNSEVGAPKLVLSQIIKSNENFNFEFARGLYANSMHIVNSTTPITYTQGNNDIFATAKYIA
jgi:hypothetical protein